MILWVSQASTPTAHAVSDINERFIEDLERLEAGTLETETAVANCEGYVRLSGDEALMEQLMSGFLDVPQSDALSVFCTALAEAVASQHLQVDKMRSIVTVENPEAQADGLGHLLREVYYAYERRSPNSAELRVAP